MINESFFVVYLKTNAIFAHKFVETILGGLVENTDFDRLLLVKNDKIWPRGSY